MKTINAARFHWAFIMIWGLALMTGSAANAQKGYPLPNDNYVNDYAGIIAAQDEQNLQTMLKNLEEQDGIEVVVVTVNSIADYNTGDGSIESFTTNLFNTWGVGDKTKNNGVLILVAFKDRKARIELGTGYGGSYDAAMKQIIDEDMIPHFRDGNHSRGIYEGTRAIVARVTDIPLNAPSSPFPLIEPPAKSLGTAARVPAAPPTPKAGREGMPLDPWAVAGLGALAAAGGGLVLRRYFRYHKRRCSNCKAYMMCLDEFADDLHLESGQKVEEYLQSVDYDVWKCPACNAHELYAYNTWFSSYKRCPSCNYRTLEVGSTVIAEATYTSDGLKRITRECRHCKYKDQDTVVIPQLTRSSNDNGSDRSSFGGSSSSGGSNFGGGRSSGGGASGSW